MTCFYLLDCHHSSVNGQFHVARKQIFSNHISSNIHTNTERERDCVVTVVLDTLFVDANAFTNCMLCLFFIHYIYMAYIKYVYCVCLYFFCCCSSAPFLFQCWTNKCRRSPWKFFAKYPWKISFQKSTHIRDANNNKTPRDRTGVRRRRCRCCWFRVFRSFFFFFYSFFFYILFSSFLHLLFRFSLTALRVARLL